MSATALPRRLAALARPFLAARLELTKPGITVFLVLVAVVGYALTAGPSARAGTALALALAVAATVGGAAALNQILERGFDARMIRTRGRPLPSERVGLREALAVAAGLSSLGLAVSALYLPWTATGALVTGHIGYVAVYTPLKRRTTACTLVGAVVGALPALAGSLAAGRPVGVAGYAFYGAVVLWQIPHFLAIGWLAREDYGRAGFRVLPAVDAAGRRTGLWAAASALVLLPVSAAPLSGGAAAGLVAVASLGAAYLWASVAFLARPGAAPARRLFLLSLVWVPAYLLLVLIFRPGG